MRQRSIEHVDANTAMQRPIHNLVSSASSPWGGGGLDRLSRASSAIYGGPVDKLRL